MIVLTSIDSDHFQSDSEWPKAIESESIKGREGEALPNTKWFHPFFNEHFFEGLKVQGLGILKGIKGPLCPSGNPTPKEDTDL